MEPPAAELDPELDPDPDPERDPDPDAHARVIPRARAVAFARGAARVAVPAAAWAAQRCARAASVTAAAAWRRRRALQALLTRGVWWAALVGWAATAIALWSIDAIDVQRSLAVFAAGAVACVAVVAFGRAAHLRWLGGVLGSMHGVSAVLLWFVANG